MKKKTVTTGHIVETYLTTGGDKPNYYWDNEIENVFQIATKSKIRQGRKKGKPDMVIQSDITANRAKNNCRRLINSNFTEESTFITLTFRDPVTRQFAIKAFQDWKKEVNRQLENEGQPAIQYVCVLEYTKKGNPHFHIVLKRIDWHYYKLWKHGYRHFVKIKHVDNVGVYITKYMTKAIQDAKAGEPKYYRSKNLLNPKSDTITLFKSNIEKEFQKDEKQNSKRVYANSYTDYHGNTIYYSEFNSKRI